MVESSFPLFSSRRPLTEEERQDIHTAPRVVGTKVRVPPGEYGRIAAVVTASLEASLARLRLDHVDIFHLHNPITETEGGTGVLVVRVTVSE